MNNTSELLFKLRTQHKFTKTKAANEIGISYSSYIRYEDGERNPPLEVLLKACQVYNVPQSYFGINSDLVAVGNKGYTIKNIESSDVLKVTPEEFEMLKGVLAAYRNK